MEEMNIKKHLPLICFLLILQFFIKDIVGLIYLPLVEHYLRKNESAQLYTESQYNPLSTDPMATLIPNDFAFVYLKKSGEQTIETYYSKDGIRTSVTYVNGIWQRTESSYDATKAFLVLPFIGFCICFLVTLHKVVRTGAVTTWDLAKHPYDQVERIGLLYGVPFFISGILFGWRLM